MHLCVTCLSQRARGEANPTFKTTLEMGFECAVEQQLRLEVLDAEPGGSYRLVVCVLSNQGGREVTLVQSGGGGDDKFEILQYDWSRAIKQVM